MNNLPTQAQFGTAISGIGGIIEGFGMISHARGQEERGDYNATIYEQQAQVARANNKLTAWQKRRQIESVMGQQVARTASSGFRYTGNPIDIAVTSLTNANLDLAIDKYNSEVKARGLQSAADMSRFEGRQAARQSYVKAGTSLLDTAFNAYQSYSEIGD